MKKVLMVGDGNHYFNRKLVEHLNETYRDIEVDFFSTINPSFEKSLPYRHIYDASVNKGQLPWLFRLRGFYGYYADRYFSKTFSEHLQNHHYDYIHFQSAPYWLNNSLKSITLHSTKLIVTIWGSDFYRASNKRLIELKDLFNKANFITFASNQISGDFDKIFHTKAKHRLARFGLDVFNYIDLNRDKIKRETSVKNKLVITIGYNRHPAQQHLAIIEAISKIESQYKKAIEVVLPYTYGPKNNEYHNKVIKFLKDSDITYKFLYDFMNEEEVAINCLKSDIMIQVQKTDAFSGSMQEYMYAGNIVITGSWLPYNDLKISNAYYETVDSVFDITEMINKVIKNFLLLKEKGCQNREILYQFSSWDNNISKWYALYE